LGGRRWTDGRQDGLGVPGEQDGRFLRAPVVCPLASCLPTRLFPFPLFLLFSFLRPTHLLSMVLARVQALENALSDLNQEFTGLKARFQQEVRRVQAEQADREYR